MSVVKLKRLVIPSLYKKALLTQCGMEGFLLLVDLRGVEPLATGW